MSIEENGVGVAEPKLDEGGATNIFSEDAGIPKEFMDVAAQNDPEYADILNTRSGKKAVEKAEEVKPEDEAGDPLEKEVKEPEEKGYEKEEITDDSFDTLEFEDNVIPGLKGEDLKKLGPDAAVALSEYHEKHTAASQELTSTKDQLQKLLADPVIQARADMLSKGRTNYEYKQLSDTERAYAVSMIQNKYGLDKEEALGIFEDLRGGFEKFAQDMAESHIQNRTIEKDYERKTEEVQNKARQVFLNFGKINPKLAFKETNASNFWKIGTGPDGKPASVLNEAHPEIEKFKQNVLPVMTALGQAGFTYNQVVAMAEQFGEDAVYALAAKKLNLPVVINAKERDQKMVATERKKALSAFLKRNGSDELRADEGGNSGSKKAKGNFVNGIDLDKLATDESYYDEVIRKKPFDETWMDLVSGMRSKAVAMHRKGRK